MKIAHFDFTQPRTFIIAELSANHGHSLDIAKQTIRAAKKAGADAIKLQTYTADTLTLNCNKEDFIVKGGTLWDNKTYYQLYQEAFTPWEWHKELLKLTKLSEFDLVVSDNLSEILGIRSDAILMGSFLWWEALDGLPAARVETARELVRGLKPRLIGTQIFAGEEIPALTRFEDVGLFGNPAIRFSPKVKKKNALLSTGRGGEMEGQATEFFTDVARAVKPDFETVFVEPSLLPKNAPSWMKPATFSPSEYETLSAAVIRPGIGTITDALSAGARIFAFREPGNRELERNAKGLETLGVGEDSGEGFKGLQEAWNSALQFHMDERAKEKHLARLLSVPLQGAEKAARILQSALASESE